MKSIPPGLAGAALDAAPDAMVIIDTAGIICFANRQATVLFDYAREQLIGRRIEELIPERYRERHIAHRHGYAGHMRVRPMGAGLELFGRRGDGSELPVEISLSPIRSGESLLIAAAIRDVSARKRAEAELIAARHSAEQARESATRANQSKSRFLSTASHDLRQPLQTLSLLNGTLRRTVTDAAAVQLLVQQEQAIDAMSHLLNALLDISKLEAGAIRPQPGDFAVSETFERLQREFEGLATNKGLAFKVTCGDESVHSDRALIEQILKNLLSNAIKYTRGGWVALRCLRAEPSSVRIEVVDTGIGIPDGQVALIYDEFYQVGSPGAAPEGYGLGLSIVRRLVTLLDARIEVHSEVGKGSLFALTVPAAHGAVRPEARAASQPAPRATRTGARVLLVEDDASVRAATTLLLKSEGYKVTAVASLAEALEEAARDPRLELLVADYHLQAGETGLQVIAALRARLSQPLKAVLITGDTSQAIAQLAGDPQLRIASKPIKAEELLGLLRALLQ
jgi:two-component system, sensor histidine kinase